MFILSVTRVIHKYNRAFSYVFNSTYWWRLRLKHLLTFIVSRHFKYVDKPWIQRTPSSDKSGIYLDLHNLKVKTSNNLDVRSTYLNTCEEFSKIKDFSTVNLWAHKSLMSLACKEKRYNEGFLCFDIKYQKI